MTPRTHDELFAYLAELGLAVETMHHPPVFTVEEAKRLRGPLVEGHAKSLLVVDRQARAWLIVVAEHRRIDFSAVASHVGASGRLTFATPETLYALLGVTPGSVTPFAVINPSSAPVTVVLDSDLLVCRRVHFHPLRNDMTTAISPADLLTFLHATSHPPVLLPGATLDLPRSTDE